MAAVKIGPKHQIRIPQEVFEALRLDVGDFLDAETRGGQIVLTPLQLAHKALTPKLASGEQQLLRKAKAKIERIRKDLVSAKGLTGDEAKVAAKAGLIDPDQTYWWTEEWQQGERNAEAERRKGQVLGPLDTVDAMREVLRKRARARA